VFNKKKRIYDDTDIYSMWYKNQIQQSLNNQSYVLIKVVTL